MSRFFMVQCVHPISRRFQVNAQQWSDFRFRVGIPLFDTLFLSYR